MNILLTFDNNYTQYAGVTLTSFLMNNQGNHTIYVISDYISEKNREMLSNICTERGSDIHYIYIHAEDTKDFPVGKGTINPTLTIATYFRLFLADLLPNTIKKVLYIDCDIIVNDSLEDLWNTEFHEGKCIAGLEEMPDLAIDGCKRMGYPLEYSYINAGVILFNLETLRKSYSVAKAIDFIKQHISNIRYHDQDVLNAMLYDKKQFIDLKYNVMDTHLVRGAVFPKRYQDYRDSIFSPVIIHYTGYFKPWNIESNNPYTFKYFEYLENTPWKGTKPTRKLKTVKSFCVFKAKHFAKMFLDFIHVKNYRYLSFKQKMPL